MSVERIGNLLAGLAKSEPFAENTRCGGALLYVSRVEAMHMGSNGVRWVLDPERLPPDGRQSWRVACSDEVMQVVRTADLPPDATAEEKAAAPKRIVKYALCSRCSGYELAIRQRLRKEAKEAALSARSGGRKRAFSEDAGDE